MNNYASGRAPGMRLCHRQSGQGEGILIFDPEVQVALPCYGFGQETK